MAAPSVFVSYAREDRERVVLYVTHLERCGLSPWVDFEKIVVGADLVHAINEAIGGSAVWVLFYSAYYARKNWPRAEMSALLYAAIEQGDRATLVTVRLDDTVLPPLLASRLYLSNPTPNSLVDEIGRLVLGQSSNRDDRDSHDSTSQCDVVSISEVGANEVEQLAIEVRRLLGRSRATSPHLALGKAGMVSLHRKPENTNVDAVLQDLDSCMRILKIHREYIRTLEARLAQGALGIFEAGFRIEYEQRLADRDSTIEKLRQYVDALACIRLVRDQL